MPLLQVRNFPEDLYRQLKNEAQTQHRSIAQQAVIVFKMGLGIEDTAMQANKVRRQKLFEKIMSREIPRSVKKIDATRLIREDRNR